MERCSYFIPNKALFGGFPTQEEVKNLEEIGVRYFIDLTLPNESKTIPYSTNFTCIKYPILDRNFPRDWKSFAKLILEICKILDSLKENEKVYIHCKGGHGRSGVLVACILCQYFHLKPEDALNETSKSHFTRPIMKYKHRIMGSPHRKGQREFVHKFFRPLLFDKPVETGFTFGFSNISHHKVSTEFGTFPNAQLAFQAYRCQDDEYLHKLREGEFCPELIHEKETKEFEEKKVEYMYKVLKNKFDQHPILKIGLMNTGLRPIIKISQDSFWGNGNLGNGHNMLGKLLCRLRNEYLISYHNKSSFQND